MSSPIQVEVHIHSAPASLDVDKLKQYIDWIILTRRGQEFAIIKMFYSNTEEYTLLSELESGNTPLPAMAIHHAVSQYCFEVHFKVKEIPSDHEKTNYVFIYAVVEDAFKMFCIPKIAGSLKYIIDPHAKPLVPVCPIPKSRSNSDEAIESDIKALSRKVEIISHQIELLQSKL